MKVILTRTLENVGKEGDLVEVADGYARNFLLPRKWALPATKGNLNRLEEIRRHQQHRRKKNLEEHQDFALQIGKTSVVLSVKVGEEGRLFGAVTASDIANALKEKTGKDLDKRKIALSEPIKHIGIYDVPVKLDPEVEASIKVEVVGA